MPPTPSRASSLYFSSRTTPTSGSGGAASATVESARSVVPSSGQTVTSESNCRPHCGHWSINFASEREHFARSDFTAKRAKNLLESAKFFSAPPASSSRALRLKISRTLSLGVRVHLFLNFRLLFALDAGHGRAFGRLAVNLHVRAFGFRRLVLARQSFLPQVLGHKNPPPVFGGLQSSPARTCARSCGAGSPSPADSTAFSSRMRLRYAALTKDANSGCGASGFDLYSGWN